jgi:uncharacterized OsmC-like protein
VNIMSGTDTVRAKLARAAQILEARPEKAQQSYSVSAGLCGAVGSRVKVAGQTVETDMPMEVGGDDTAPSPGKLLLAAIAACVTTGVAQACARHGLNVEDIQVDVEADIDTRGVFCPRLNVSAAFQGIRARVNIYTEESTEAVHQAIEESEACSTVSHTLAAPPKLEINVLPPSGA